MRPIEASRRAGDGKEEDTAYSQRSHGTTHYDMKEGPCKVPSKYSKLPVLIDIYSTSPPPWGHFRRAINGYDTR